MSLRPYAVAGLEVGAVVAVVSLVVGAALGQPILLSYVTSQSMEPTISAGDGFVAVPSALAGDVEEGDVIVFRAQEIQGGGLTTHRVVDVTDRGYVTKGDNNPFTDQAGPEPPVTDERVVAQALQVGDTVVTIPHLGTAVTGVQGLLGSVVSLLGLGGVLGSGGVGTVFLVLGAALLAAAVLLDSPTRPDRDRKRTRERPGTTDTRTTALVLLAIVLVPANAAMVLPGGVQQTVIDGAAVAESDLAAGEPVAWEYDITNNGAIPLVAVFEPGDERVSVADPVRTLGPGETVTVDAAATPPPSGETVVVGVVEHRYLQVLPAGVIAWLHGLDPLAALGAVNAVLAALVLAPVEWLVGIGRVRVREGRVPSLAGRLWGLVR